MPDTSGYSDLKQSDLQDPTLWAVNQRLRSVYSRLNQLIGQGKPNLLSSPKFRTAFASGQQATNIQGNEFVTKDVADSMYGPTAIQKALDTGIISVFGAETQQTVQSIQSFGRGGKVLYDTHANRLKNYPPSEYALGTLFYETDRELLYYVALSIYSNIPVWQYALGCYVDLMMNRPEDTQDGDQGMMFFATDYQLLFQCEDAKGNCDTSGTQVVINFSNPTSQPFDTHWVVGTKVIIINGVTYSIASVFNIFTVILATSAGTQTDVSYIVPAGCFRYLDGICVNRYSWWGPAGLTPADDGTRLLISNLHSGYALFSFDYQSNTDSGWTYLEGFLEVNAADLPQLSNLGFRDAGLNFFISDYDHWVQYTGTGGYQWSPWEMDGSGYYRISQNAPNWGKWAVADGSTVNVFVPGGLTQMTTANLNGDLISVSGGDGSLTSITLATGSGVTLTTWNTKVWFRQ